MHLDPNTSASARLPLHGLIWFTALIVLIGCAPAVRWTPPTRLEPEASAVVLDRMGRINAGLKTFKGIGRLEIETGERHQTARVVWVGNLADCLLRLDLLGAGLPLASLASDGRRFYLRRDDTGSVQSRPASNPSLEDFLGLPVTVADILFAMAGRIPDLARDKVSVHADETANTLWVVFHRRFGGQQARVILDADGEQLRELAFYRFDGSLHYRVVYRDHRSVNGYRLPYRIEIQDNRGLFRLQVGRWWTDVSLNEGVFALEAPEG